MKILFTILSLFLTSQSFAKTDYKQLKYTTVYLLSGVETVETNNGEQENSLNTFGMVFRIGQKWHMGGYYSENHEYGWMLGYDLNKVARLSFSIGKAKKTKLDPDFTYSQEFYAQRNERSTSIGVLLDFNLTGNVGFTGGVSTYKSGSDSFNPQYRAGLSFYF